MNRLSQISSTLLTVLLVLSFVLISPPAHSASGTVLITAVYYDTYLTNEPDEAFRLLNVSGSAADLSDWTVTDGEGTVTLSGTLDSRQSIWVTLEAVSFAQEFGFTPDYEYGADTDATVPNLTQTGNFAFANSGDQVLLKNSGAAIVDSVVYENGDPTGTGWSGSPIEPYGGTSVGVERFAVLGPDEAEGFGLEGQILYRKLDQATGLPEANSDNAFDWAQDPIDNINGEKVQYPGWDLEQYFFTKTFTEPASLTYAIAPDHIFEAVLSEIKQATTNIYIEGYTFKNAATAEAIVAQMQANPEMTVKILLEGEPVGGIVDQQRWICQQIESAGGEVYFMHNDDANGIHDRYNYQHGKWMIIDEEVLLTGSENLNRSSMPADDKSNGTEGNREFAIQVQSDEAFSLLSGVFWHDWYLHSVYLPAILGNHQVCVPAGGGTFLTDRCCSGLSGLLVIHPCDTPGEGFCDLDGCLPPLPCGLVCSPCGNDLCEPEYRENRCNCPVDCG